VWHPLWREDGSVIYCTIASRPCQSSHSWVEVPQNSRPYFNVSSETPPTWRARSPYLYPPGTGWPSYTPGHWVPLSPLLTCRDCGGGILTRLHTVGCINFLVDTYCMRDETRCLAKALIIQTRLTDYLPFSAWNSGYISLAETRNGT
jgi:hypothetical protein